ncbi:hypothetical protein LX90_007724 [Lentzea flava]|nr:hypothetical protein [Lentzea flava]
MHTMSRPGETEQELRRAAEAGEVLDLSRRGDNTLPAKAIRDLLRAGDVDPRGVRVHGARVTGRLDLIDLHLQTSLELDKCMFEETPAVCDAELRSLTFDRSTLPSLDAAGLRVRYFGMRNARTQSLNLDNASIDGPLLIHGSSVGLMYGRGLRVNRAVAASGLYATTLWLDGCDIGGDLQLYKAVIVNESGGALLANSARVGGAIFLDEVFIKAGGSGTAVRLIEASAGSLLMRRAVVRSWEETAINLDGAQFRQEVRLDDGFDVLAHHASDCAIRMVDTHTGAGLGVRGSVRNHGGQALVLNKAVIGASVVVTDTVIEAASRRAAVEVSDTSVNSELAFRPTKLINNGTGPELSLVRTKVGDALSLNVPALLETEDFVLTINGLTYPEPPSNTSAWLKMLNTHTAGYEAQPYQQLAAVHRAAGHEHTARKVLIAQQRDLRRRGDPGNKLWHWFLGVTLGYGYKPSRAVAGLLITFVLALCLVWTAGEFNGLTPAKDRPADACSPVNRISLAADLAIPLVKLGGTPRCELANGPAGQWATGAGWVVQILGWSFATLSVAGFTGLVRKS